MDLQKKLGGITVDGVYGPATQAAVKANPDVLKPAEPVTPVKTDASPEKQVTPDADDADTAYANYQKQQELIKRGEENAKYKALQDRLTGVNPSQYLTKTGNMQKPWTELKDGDIDYDNRGVKQVYRKGADGGPGNWQASFDSFGDWKKEPGLGIVGNSASSPEGQKYVQDRQNRILTPDEAALLKSRQQSAPQQQPVLNPLTKEPTQESVGFQNDELNRIVSLVHYR